MKNHSRYTWGQAGADVGHCPACGRTKMCLYPMTEYGYPHLKLCVYCSVELAAGVVDNIRALEGQ